MFLKKIILKFYSLFDFSNKFNIKISIGKNEYVKFICIDQQTRNRALNLLTKERDTIKWIDSFKKGERFLDIGAHMGVYSLYAARKKKVKVVSVEPALLNISILMKNIILNEQSKNIICTCLGVSNKNEYSDFFIPVENSKQNLRSLVSGMAKKPINFRTNKPINQFVNHKVNLVTIDYLQKKFKNFDHIKIDIDGDELNVLHGSKSTLKNKNLKTVLIELNVYSKDYQKILKIFKKNGFFLDKKLQEIAHISIKPVSKIKEKNKVLNHIFKREIK